MYTGRTFETLGQFHVRNQYDMSQSMQQEICTIGRHELQHLRQSAATLLCLRLYNLRIILVNRDYIRWYLVLA